MAKPNKSGKKGTSGKGEGVKARKNIKAQKKKGSTNADIGRAINRDESTVPLIENGTIKNPPKGIAAKVKKAKTSSKKPVKRTMASKKKATASRNKHK